MKITKVKNIVDLEQMLQSDDEFPSEYSEAPSIPAYLDDNRFLSPEIVIPWVFPSWDEFEVANKTKNKSNEDISSDTQDYKAEENFVTKGDFNRIPSNTSYKDTSFISKSMNDSQYIEYMIKIDDEPEENLSDEDISEKTEVLEQWVLLGEGFLPQLYMSCFKAIKDVANYSTMLWFSHFLMCKDIQSEHYIPTSVIVEKLSTNINELYTCLVPEADEKQNKVTVKPAEL